MKKKSILVSPWLLQSPGVLSVSGFRVCRFFGVEDSGFEGGIVVCCFHGLVAEVGSWDTRMAERLGPSALSL